MLLRNLQDISQLYTKYTENTLLTHNNDNDVIIIVITVINDGNNLRIKKKFSFK